jgi:hypothetical protein
LDDLHWADVDSLALVSFLCRQIGSHPIAIVATLRPWPPEAREVAVGLVHDGAGGDLERRGPPPARPRCGHSLRGAYGTKFATA